MPLKKIHHNLTRERQKFWAAPKNQLERARQNPMVRILILIEILLAVVLAMGLWVYANPAINLISAPYNGYLFWLSIGALLTGLFAGVYLISHSEKIKKTAKEKLHIAKNEIRIPALLALEFFLSMVIVMATFIYLDPDYNVIEWPFNLIFFMIVFGLVSYIYMFSKPFRKEYRDFFNIK